MTDTEILIEVAKLDGWVSEVRKRYAGSPNVAGFGRNIHLSLGHPDREFTLRIFTPYLTSRDAIIPVVEKQPVEIKRKIAHEFYGVPKVGGFIEDDYIACLLAPARRICIALLKATGTFKD